MALPPRHNSPHQGAPHAAPFVISAPGVAKPGGVAEHPVSLIDIYPTLVDLCGLEGDTRKNNQGARLDGHSVRPFLENPMSDEWTGPDTALTMVFAGPETKGDPSRQHWSVRTKRWRYILYNIGSEELYDHDADPYEWTNLSGNTRFAAHEHHGAVIVRRRGVGIRPSFRASQTRSRRRSRRRGLSRLLLRSR
jgi:arylsulfatase A-like enzyme